MEKVVGAGTLSHGLHYSELPKFELHTVLFVQQLEAGDDPIRDMSEVVEGNIVADQNFLHKT